MSSIVIYSNIQMMFFAYVYLLDVTCVYKFTNFSGTNKMQS